MVNLKQLRVVELKELAKECDIKLKMKLKADIIQEIKGAGINDDYLESLVSKYKKSKPVSKKTTTTSTTKIETRINSLEKQVKFLMEKFNDIEYHLSMKEVQPKESTENDIKQIKDLLISSIPRADSLNIDEIYNSKPFNKVPFKIFEKAVIELIDDEYFDGSAGKSKYKIDGTIGRIIRR